MPFQPSSRPQSSAAQWGNILGGGLAGLGQGAAAGIEQGLNLLAQNKLQKMQEMTQARQKNELSQLLQQNQYAPQVADFMSHLYYNNPKAFAQHFPGFERQEPVENQQGTPANPFENPIDQNTLRNYMMGGGQEPTQQALSGFQQPQSIQPEQQAIPQAQRPAPQRLLKEGYGQKGGQQEKESLARFKAFQPKFNEIEKEGKASRTLKHTTEQALEVFNRHKAQHGIVGKFTPAYLQTPDGQVLTSKLQQIVLYRSQQGKGIPHKARLLLEEGAKASIWQDPKAIEEILNDQLNDPEMNREIARDDARERLLEEYGTNIPQDIFPQIDHQSREILKSSSQKQMTRLLSELSRQEPASNHDEGDIADNPSTGKPAFQVKNGKWELI